MHILILADLLGGFGVNLIAFLSQLVSFGIVFFILWRWGLPAILSTMEKRQAVIREGVENAEKAKRDLEEATRRADELMLEARRQAQDTIAQAAKAAEGEANRIREEAHAQAEQISTITGGRQRKTLTLFGQRTQGKDLLIGLIYHPGVVLRTGG